VVGVSHKLLGGPRGGFLLCTRELAERIDRAVFPFVQGGPMVNQLAAKAYIFGQADRPAFGDYAAQCVANAQVLAEGLAAEGFRPLTGGTDTHLVTVDAEATGLTGRELELRAEEAGLLLGRCAVPFAPTPPSEAAGLRMGTAWTTSQGLREPELEHVARLIGRIARGDRGAAGEIRELAQSTKPQCGESASF
jgi:glycine hydroxymethyltransferase